MSLRDLHRTYGAVHPHLRPAAHLALTARGVARYGDYWVGLGLLPLRTSEGLDRLVEGVGTEAVLAGMAQGRGQVLVLLHQGHWEVAGAWAGRRLGGLTTVAEVLRSRSLMGALTRRARAAAGLEVVPADGGAAGARRLVEVLRGGGAVALLADRDLADRGVRARRIAVDLAGVTTTLAAGPAELAVAAGADLRPVTVETLGWRAPRHRVTFGAPVPAGTGARAERVAAMTRACADVLGDSVRRSTADWHLTAPVVPAGRPG